MNFCGSFFSNIVKSRKKPRYFVPPSSCLLEKKSAHTGEKLLFEIYRTSIISMESSSSFFFSLAIHWKFHFGNDHFAFLMDKHWYSSQSVKPYVTGNIKEKREEKLLGENRENDWQWCVLPEFLEQKKLFLDIYCEKTWLLFF